MILRSRNSTHSVEYSYFSLMMPGSTLLSESTSCLHSSLVLLNSIKISSMNLFQKSIACRTSAGNSSKTLLSKSPTAMQEYGFYLHQIHGYQIAGLWFGLQFGSKTSLNSRRTFLFWLYCFILFIWYFPGGEGWLEDLILKKPLRPTWTWTYGVSKTE